MGSGDEDDDEDDGEDDEEDEMSTKENNIANGDGIKKSKRRKSKVKNDEEVRVLTILSFLCCISKRLY